MKPPFSYCSFVLVGKLLKTFRLNKKTNKCQIIFHSLSNPILILERTYKIMEQIDCTTSTAVNEPPNLVKMKAASDPVCSFLKKSEEMILKTKISAPSYFYSLEENDAPPFIKPSREVQPKLLLGTIMNEVEAVAMIAAFDVDQVNGLKKFLGMGFVIVITFF